MVKFIANELVIKNRKVSGEYNWAVGEGSHRKSKIIKGLCNKLGISLKEVIYIGDTHYDIEAFKIVGKAIAFNAESKELKREADVVVDSNDLRDVIPYLET